MGDTAQSKEHALEIARLLDSHRAEDTVVLNVGKMSSWTYYFVICTVTSQTHMRGLIQYVTEYFRQKKIKAINSLKNANEQGWVLIDCGDLIIHLMAKEQREFYELEKLWFNSERLYHS